MADKIASEYKATQTHNCPHLHSDWLHRVSHSHIFSTVRDDDLLLGLAVFGSLSLQKNHSETTTFHIVLCYKNY